MPRKVYIIPKTMKIEDAYPEAERLGIGEICQGIPPVLVREGKIKEEDLPLVYEEAPVPEPEKMDLEKVIKDLEKRVSKLEEG